MSDSKKSKAELGTELALTLFGRGPDEWTLPEPLKTYTLEHLFGDVWQGAALDKPERSLLTCAVLTATGREAEQRVHFKGAKNLGVPREKMVDMISHVAHYAGWPFAVSAMRILQEVWPETSDEEA